MTSTAYAFIGIGAMGRPMAARMLGAGLPLTVNTRSQAKAADLIAGGAGWAATPLAAADSADVVLTCVTDNAATEQVLFGPDGVASSKRVKCVVDFSTSGPPTAGEIGRRLNEKGIAFVDAPVTGGTPRAANGTLTIIAAGDAKAIEMAQPAFAVLGSNVFVAGAQPGQAQMVKLVNNMLNYLAMAATAEAMVVGVKAGLDPQLMLDVLNTGTGKNSATEVKFPKAVLTRSFNYGATNHTVDKDLLLFLDEAERMKLPSPIARNLSDLWHGWAKEHPLDDITTITKMYEHWAGVEVRGKAK
jgi:3-hydroxyisobutyrate dehydrogenase-like beta-hydroxyacid dehydrogenase